MITKTKKSQMKTDTSENTSTGRKQMKTPAKTSAPEV
jgi:hypothetical protein